MAFAEGIVYRRLAPGQTLTIFGGYFDSNCSVQFGGTIASIVDYDDDHIEAIVPSISGSFDVVLNDGTNNIKVGTVEVLELADTPKRWYPKEYTQADFASYVRSLLPRGNVFALSSGSNFSKLLNAIANAYKYTWETIKSMVDAVDPTHTENLSGWEGELNLPVLGITPSTEEGRRAEIYRIECLEGGCTKAFFERIISLMGINADVYEYTQNPEKFAGIDVGEDNIRFYFMISFNVSADDFTYFTAGDSSSDDYLLDFSDYAEEAVFRELKPSHTNIVFAYVASVIVIGGNSYTTKKINNLVWTTENLNEDVGTNAYYENDESYSQYGRLYNKDDDTYAAIEALLSDGWRIPTLDDFNDLLGSDYSVLDYCTTDEWKTSSGSALATTNKTGFSLRPAGTKYYAFYGQGFVASLCTSTKDSSTSSNPYYCLITREGGSFGKYSYEGEVLCSVRLCKDA